MISSIALAAAILSSPSPTPGFEAAREVSVSKPVRAQRASTIMFESGLNSMTGIGGVGYTWNAHPHLSLDTGAGLSLQGFRLSGRVRYNVLTTGVTPFFGAGLSRSFGFDSQENVGRDAPFHVDAVNAAQLTTGLSWIARGGFSLLAAVGYSFNLNDPKYLMASNNADKRRAWNSVMGNAPVLSLAMGYSF